MALKASTFKSVINFTEKHRQGITLKSRTLKICLKRKGYGQTYFAARLGMSRRNLMRKLYMRQTFNQREITELVRLLGARMAIKVIWFPSLREKRKIQRYVWWKQMSEKKNFKDLQQDDYVGNNNKLFAEQEQGDEIEKLIFTCKKLPSRKFMRRRNV